MSENLEKTTKIQGVISILFVAALMATGYSWYLYSTGQSLVYLEKTLASSWLYIPPELLAKLGYRSFQGLLAAVFITAVHVCVYMYAGLFAAVYIGHWLNGSKSKSDNNPVMPIFTQQIDPNGYYLKPKNKKTEIILKTPTGKTIKNIVPLIQMRLDRATLKLKKAPATAVEKLEIALIATLAKHQDWPADPRGHHSDTNLYKHSLSVSKKLQEATNNHPLAKVIGLAHDIGKLLAYEKFKESDGSYSWDILSKRHDKLSAHIVTLLPEFEELEEHQQNTINTVLAFCHHPEQLPQRKISNAEITLIQKLREVDGLATNEEQTADVPVDMRQELIEILPQIIVLYVLPVLNINQSRDMEGHADGWTNPGFEYIAVQERVIREGLKTLRGSRITVQQAMSLGLETPPTQGKRHKATDIIIESLTSMDYVFKEFNGVMGNGGLFSVRAGALTFDYIILFKRSVLEDMIPDIVELWGKSQYKLKVKMLNYKKT